MLLQLLIKSTATINKQQIISECGGIEVFAANHSNELSASLHKICAYMSEVYAFRLDVPDESNEASGALTSPTSSQQSASTSEAVFEHLKRCVSYLLNKNEKIFIKLNAAAGGAADEGPTFKLNAQYIVQKLQETQVMSPKPPSLPPPPPPPPTSTLPQANKQHSPTNTTTTTTVPTTETTLEASVSSRDLNPMSVKDLLGSVK